jgi:hypothetical protein
MGCSFRFSVGGWLGFLMPQAPFVNVTARRRIARWGSTRRDGIVESGEKYRIHMMALLL